MLDPHDIGMMEDALSARDVPVAVLCRRAGINASTWGRWKNGAFAPSYRKGCDVKAAFDDILREQGESSAEAA